MKLFIYIESATSISAMYIVKFNDNLRYFMTIGNLMRTKNNRKGQLNFETYLYIQNITRTFIYLYVYYIILLK